MNAPLRRFLCLPPAASPLQGADEKPETLRQALYPLTILFTLAYLGLMAREFIHGPAFAPKGISPEIYFALLGVYTGDEELRSWRGRPDVHALEAEFIIYAWWLFYWVAILAANLTRGYFVPPLLSRVCLELLAIFGLGRVSWHSRKMRGMK